MNEKPIRNWLDSESAASIPIISYSHFLPRRELLFPTPRELEMEAEHKAAVNREASTGGTPVRPQKKTNRFNFSTVAGCLGLDAQLRRVGASVHVFGHQHRNRDRHLGGVRYVSHCLGYTAEQVLVYYFWTLCLRFEHSECWEHMGK